MLLLVITEQWALATASPATCDSQVPAEAGAPAFQHPPSLVSLLGAWGILSQSPIPLYMIPDAVNDPISTVSQPGVILQSRGCGSCPETFLFVTIWGLGKGCYWHLALLRGPCPLFKLLCGFSLPDWTLTGPEGEREMEVSTGNHSW